MNSEEKIIWKKCNNCGLLQHSSHLRCLNCKHETFKSMAASGSAKLLTYTILKAPPAEFRDKPQYALGVLEFENGVKALGQITPHDHLKVGMMMFCSRARLTALMRASSFIVRSIMTHFLLP